MNNKLTKITAFSLALTALVSAGPASAAKPSITTDSVTEGETFSIPLSHKCGVKKCRYAVTTVDGTATAGSDYTAQQTSGSARKGGTFSATLTIPTVGDAACEANETVAVKVTLTKKSGSSDTIVYESIVDNDCSGMGTGTPPAPPAQPGTPPTTPAPAPTNPGPAVPADDNTPPKPTTTTVGNKTIQSCFTPFRTGVAGGNGATGSFVGGCAVDLTCRAAVCGATQNSSINTEKRLGHKVTLNSRLHIHRNGQETFYRDKPCEGPDSCSAQDYVQVAYGDVVSVDCNGVRATVADNRATVGCTLTMENLA